MELAQINAEIEAEEANNEDVMEHFNNFLAQIGIEDTETFFTQLGSELTDD